MSACRRRLRVLSLIDSIDDQGGAERFATGLAMHLPEDRFEAWMCATRRSEPAVVRELEAAGVRHLNLGRSGKLDVHRFQGLTALLRRERFDVLHAHMFGSNAWGTTIGRALGVPVILAHEHNWSYAGSPWRKWIDRRVIARLATRFVAVSAANRARMVELEGVPVEKIVVLPTAYIPHAVTSDGDIRAELGLSADSRLVGVAASLRKEKALEILIQAHARVLSRIDDVHLVIAGDGDCRGELERLVRELGVQSSVHFLGPRRDVDSILRAVDVGAMSSDWEGMPLFVFECMATSTPVVATAVGGLPEIVDDGKTGLLVPPRDPAALSQALESLLVDEARRTQLAATAARRIGEFTIDAVAARFADLYEALTDEAGGGHRSNRFARRR